MNSTLTPVTYFDFEADFVEDEVRCIPMIVRFKLDACGIKLKLKEWSRMTNYERERLATAPCQTATEVAIYKDFLLYTIYIHTGEKGTEIPVPGNPPWACTEFIPSLLDEKLREFNWSISIVQWLGLSELQRFALLKLCQPGHENRNFPRAVKEFNLC